MIRGDLRSPLSRRPPGNRYPAPRRALPIMRPRRHARTSGRSAPYMDRRYTSPCTAPIHVYHAAMTSSRSRIPRRRTATARSAGIYSRVSQLRRGQSGDESDSIAEQDTECREACEDRSWPIVAEYADPGISASEFSRVKDRPNWSQFVAGIASGNFSVAVLWESSRGERKPIEWMQFLYLCRERDCLVHIVNHDMSQLGVTYDMNRPSDLDKLSREGLDNAKASTDTALRIRRTKHRRRVRGAPDGRCPYGYTRRYDPRTGALVEQVPDPATAPIVRELYGRSAAREPQQSICDDLNRRGVATASGSAEWTPSTLLRILERPAYAGLIVWDGTEYEASWDALVDVDLWRAVRHIYAARRATGERPGRALHLLSYIAECAVCGGPMQALPARASYACTRGHAAANQARLDLHIEAVIVEYWSRPDRVEALLAPPGDSASVVAAEEVASTEAELAELYRDAERGGVSARLAATLERGLLRRLEDARERCVEPAVEPSLRALTAGPVAATAGRWAEMSVAAKRSVVRQTVRVVVSPAGRGRRVALADRVRVLAL